MPNAPDLVILNAALTTFDPDRPAAQALAVRGRHIQAVGSTAQIRALTGPQTRVVDAGGATVLPGFIDSHVHLFGGAAELDMLDLTGLRGLDRLTRAVRAYAADRPEDPLIMGVAAYYDILAPGQGATRQDLDHVLPDRPLALMTSDHHTVFANTLALQRAGILHGAPVPEGSEIVLAPDGTATGQLNETGAFGPVLRLSALGGRDLLGYVTGGDPTPPATAQERAFDKEVILRGLTHCAGHGITGLHNMDGNFYQLELLAELEAEGPHRMTAGDNYWRLISLISLSYRGFVGPDGTGNVEALREVMRLFSDVSDQLTEAQIGALSAVSARPRTRTIQRKDGFHPARGMEVTLKFDEDLMDPAMIVTLSAALDRFLGDYAAVNTFTQCVVTNSKGNVLKVWPPRGGSGPLL